MQIDDAIVDDIRHPGNELRDVVTEPGELGDDLLERCPFEGGPCEHWPTVADRLAQRLGEQPVGPHFRLVQPLGVCRFLSVRYDRVTTPLERNQAVRMHSLMVGQGEARCLEVDQVHPPLKFFELSTEIRRNENLAAPGVFDLPELSLRGGANGPVLHYEAIFGDLEERRFLLADHPVRQRGAVKCFSRADRKELEHVRLRLGQHSPTFGKAVFGSRFIDAKLTFPTLGPTLDLDGVNG